MSGSKKADGRESSPDLSQAITIEVFGRTDVGLVREHNEDNFLVADLTAGNRSIRPEVRTHCVGPKGSIFVVCDGMGGAAAGEVASQIGVDTIYDMMQSGEPPGNNEALAQRLEKALCEAGRRILTAARLNRTQRGMGTTVTAAVLTGPRLIVGQVGDSRAYIIRNGHLVQITKDQSLVQQLIDAKQMTEEEARSFDKNNIILQALGTAEEVHVDVTSVVLKRGDTLVMCSDGLCGLVDNDTICEIVLEAPNPMDACRRLTEKACEAGGHDNITVIVGSFGGGMLEPPPESGLQDEELVYERFQFTRASETTARSLRPNREAEHEQNTVPELNGESRPTPALVPQIPPKKNHSSLIGGIAVAVLFLIGIIAYLSSGEFSDELPSSQSTQAPSEAPAIPVSTPQPVISSVPEHDDNDEPSLSPTPAEAIMKREETGPGEPSGDEDAISLEGEHSAKRPVKGKRPLDSLPVGDGKAKDGKSDPESPTSPLPESETAPEDEKNGDDHEQDNKSHDKTAGSNNAVKLPNGDNATAPKPIDENPFN